MIWGGRGPEEIEKKKKFSQPFSGGKKNSNDHISEEKKSAWCPPTVINGSSLMIQLLQTTSHKTNIMTVQIKISWQTRLFSPFLPFVNVTWCKRSYFFTRVLRAEEPGITCEGLTCDCHSKNSCLWTAHAQSAQIFTLPLCPKNIQLFEAKSRRGRLGQKWSSMISYLFAYHTFHVGPLNTVNAHRNLISIRKGHVVRGGES